MYWINTYDNNSTGISGEYSIQDAERNFNMSIKRCKPTDNKVVMTHDGTIFTGKSRYQAEQALNYLKTIFHHTPILEFLAPANGMTHMPQQWRRH
jgi:hypothetical protein